MTVMEDVQPTREEKIAQRRAKVDDAKTKFQTVEDLSKADDETFRSVVDIDMKFGGEFRHLLSDPANASRWYTALIMMSKSVEGQLASRAADLKAKTRSLSVAETNKARNDHDRWRATILRVKTGIDETLAHARSVVESQRNSMYKSIIADERDFLASRVKSLTDAINAFRDHSCDQEGCPLDHCLGEEKLWSKV